MGPAVNTIKAVVSCGGYKAAVEDGSDSEVFGRFLKAANPKELGLIFSVKRSARRIYCSTERALKKLGLWEGQP